MTNSSASTSPLSGVRVFDLTKNVAGPYATLILADLGADVIKVEDTVRGDETRYFSPSLADGIATTFASLNRGKRSVSVDLKAGGETRSDVEGLIASSDVFIENLRPGAVDALGLSFERVAELNPKIVYCSISAYSDQGDHAGAPGYDAMMQAYTGLMELTGEAEGPPSRIGTGVLDMGAGMWAALRILAALHGDPAQPKGATHIKISLVETAAAFVIHHIAASSLAGVHASRLGTAQHNTAPYEAIRAHDGSIMVAAASQKLYERLCHAIERPELISDQRFLTNDDRVANRYELVAEIEKTTTNFKVEDVVRTLEGARVPVSPIRTLRDFAEDPELVALDWWRRVEGQDWLLPGLPLERPEPGTTFRVPSLGEDTEEVLRSVRERRP